MPSCERCWGEYRRRDFFTGTVSYEQVLREREASGAMCTPEEQAGQFWCVAHKKDSRTHDKADDCKMIYEMEGEG